MTMQDTLLELNAARLAGEALSLIAAIDNELKNKVNENADIKSEFYIVFEKSEDKVTDTKLEIKGKKPYKFKTKSNIKSIRVVGNLEILKKKKALSLNLKPDKQDVEQLATILQTIGTDIDIVLDIVNDNLVRVRLYKHNPKFDMDKNEKEKEEDQEDTKQKTKKKTKKEDYEFIDENFDEYMVNEENDIFNLIDQIRQEYAFDIIFYESDLLIEDINLTVDIKLTNDYKIDELIDKYRDKPDEIIIALVIYEYLKNSGAKINYDLEKVVEKETTLFINPNLFEIVYNESITYDKIKFEKFLHTLPQKIKNALDALKQAVIRGAKAVSEYIKKHHIDLIIIMLLIGQIFLLSIIAVFGFLNFIGIPGTAILYYALQQ